jgi:membrane-associated phospholipid phosphatase
LEFLHNLQWVLPLRSPALIQLALGFSWLGYATFIMFFVAIGYWTWDKALFYRLLVLVAINALLNAFFKDWVQDPRPPLALRLDDQVGETYGLPSGHAQLAVVMWLWLAWELRRTWVWFLCSSIALGVMLSRMVLGVHDLEDVLVGAALGGASLVVFERLRHISWPWNHSTTWAALVVAGITAVALLTWPTAHAPEYIPLLAGWLITATWSLRWDQRHLQFSTPPSFWRKLVIGLLGTACFIGEQKLIKLLATVAPMDPMLWALIKGLVGGLFVSLWMPMLFVRLHLALPSPALSTDATH